MSLWLWKQKGELWFLKTLVVLISDSPSPAGRDKPIAARKDPQRFWSEIFPSSATARRSRNCSSEFFYFLFFIFLILLLSLPGNSARLTRVWLQQPQEQRYPVLQVHAGPFRISVIHWTLTWTTGSLTCIRDHSYACVYTLGLGTPTMNQHNIFDSEKLSLIFLVLLIGFQPRVFGSWVRRSTN